MIKTLIGSLSLGIALFLAPPSFAQLDDASRNLLIEKLDKVYLNLPPKDSSKVAVTLRLADLYADRARVESMAELNQACNPCTAGNKDRIKALRLYSEVVDRTPEASQGKVMVQIGHLYQLTGSEEKALGFYQKILGQNSSPVLQGEASLSIAEIYFKRRDFSKALGHYEQVLSNPSASSQGLAAYRMAWSHFNLGNIETAISNLTKLLKTPSQLNRSSQSSQVDLQFHEEVARDYVTFLGKVKIEKSHAESLYTLSPETTRVQNVQSLAYEAERLGKKAEALQVWNFIYAYLAQPQDRLAAQVAMAQLHLDLGDKKAALASYETGLQLAKELKNCESNQCLELRRRARFFVVAWHQSEKKQPTADLLAAYELFLSLYSEDVEMHLFAAAVAKDLGSYQSSFALYEKGRKILKETPEDIKKLETILLTQIELAESSKDDLLLQQAYDNYLALSRDKKKHFEVSYQKARTQYEKGNYNEAVNSLKAVALRSDGSRQIRAQAADLSLDALVLLKDDARLEAWSREYAKILPDNAKSYSQITQKSVLTRSATMSEKNLDEAYAALLTFQVAQASSEDAQKFYKNKLIMAERLKKYSEALAAANELLKIQGLSKEDQEFAWDRKAYLSELMLDFATALAATEKLQAAGSLDQRALKLAMFSELAGQSSSPYYQQYLKISNNQDNKTLVAAELVRKSKTPEKEIQSLRPHLQSNPELLALLYAEVYSKNLTQSSVLKSVSGDSKLKNTEAGKLLVRIEFLQDLAGLKSKLSAHQLDVSSDRKLAQTIKARAALIEKLEGFAQIAIQSSDWTSQLVTIDLLAKQSERFYQDLLSAPMPQGLTPEEEGEYLNLLSNQAAPFQTKATEAKVKVDQFWKNSQWHSALTSTLKQTALQNLILQEIAVLKEIAPPEYQSQLASLQVAPATTPVDVQKQRPSVAEMVGARQLVHANPMDKAALESLLALERRAGNQPMVQYLQTRISDQGAM